MRQFGALPGLPLAEKYGGLDNIQRVRVLVHQVTEGTEEVTFEPVTKLPPALVAEKRAREEREAKRKAVLAEVERLIGPAREFAVDGDQIARPRRLARDDDLVPAQARFERELR